MTEKHKYKREHRISMRFPLGLIAQLKQKQADIFTKKFLKVSQNDLIIDAILAHYGWEHLRDEYIVMKEDPKAEDVDASHLPEAKTLKQATNKVKQSLIESVLGPGATRRRRRPPNVSAQQSS